MTVVGETNTRHGRLGTSILNQILSKLAGTCSYLDSCSWTLSGQAEKVGAKWDGQRQVPGRDRHSSEAKAWRQPVSGGCWAAQTAPCLSCYGLPSGLDHSMLPSSPPIALVGPGPPGTPRVLFPESQNNYGRTDQLLIWWEDKVICQGILAQPQSRADSS